MSLRLLLFRQRKPTYNIPANPWANMTPCLLPIIFIPTHKSHLANRKFRSFLAHDGFAVLTNKSKVEISRRRKEDVMTALK